WRGRRPSSRCRWPITTCGWTSPSARGTCGNRLSITSGRLTRRMSARASTTFLTRSGLATGTVVFPSWTPALAWGGAGVFKFPTHWADEVVAVSTRPEFQNALVSLIDPDKVELDYDWRTGTETVTNDGVVWTGQA